MGAVRLLFLWRNLESMKKLLIVGAGGHGKVVAEVAQDCGYEQIAFLDDNSPEAIGTVAEMEKFTEQCYDAFVGIGNNQLRANILKRLKNARYHIPVLIHPTAYISKTAEIHPGTVVEPKAIVNTSAVIEEGCIISVGAIVDHDTKLEQCVHVNAGAIVKAGATVKAYRKLEAGEVIQGYGAKEGRK